MFEVSEEYIELMDDETSVLDVSVSCTFGGAITVGGDVIQKIVLTETVNGDPKILTLGNACSHSVLITMMEPPILGYKGVSCNPKCGIRLSDGTIEQVPLGNFWVDSVKTDDDYRTVSVEAYDKMYKLASIPFNQPASEVDGAYKVLFENYVQKLEETAGITVVRPEGGFPLWYIEKQIEDGAYNCRDIAGHLAGCLGKNATFNRNGDMEFVFYTQTAVKAVEELQYMRGFEKLSDNPLKIDFLVTGTDDEPIELENDGTDPGKLDWKYFDSFDPNDFPWLTFTYDDTTMTASVRLTEGYEADTAAIKIPSTLKVNKQFYTVTSVDAHGFYNCSATAIVLPHTLTQINDYAFENCKNITDITVPENVSYIGRTFVRGCDSLETVRLDAIACSSSNGVTSGAFDSLENDITVVVGSGVTEIGSNLFGLGGKIVSVNIPESVTTIGKKAFKGCTKLTHIEIPNSVTSIGLNAFEDSGLTSITIPSSVTSISSYVFADCKSLKAANVLCATVPSRCFAGCSALTDVTLGNAITTIGSYAFSGCSLLTEITIPSGVTSIGSSTFEYCTSLKTVYWNATKCTSVGSLSSTSAFNERTSITSVVIGDGVTSLPKYMLRNCTGVTSLSIPSSMTSIHSDAFVGCSGITEITVHKAAGSISGSPWGATNATISWVG